MAALTRLRGPPRLRTIETDRDRRATWLELFFDLVFVVAVAELGRNLDDDPTLGGFLRFVALFVPVWWRSASSSSASTCARSITLRSRSSPPLPTSSRATDMASRI